MLRLFLVLLLAAPSLAQTAESYRQRAIELSRKKSWHEAIANYQQAIALNTNDASTHYNFALALKYKGDTQQAVQEFQAALRLKPKWSDAHYGLGATWYDLQDFTAALKELQTAVKLEPANAAVHRFLARVYAQQNDTSDAEHELLQALQLKPSAEMYFELGLVRAQAGNLPSGVAAFRRALQLNPRFSPAHLMLGIALRRSGSHNGALTEFRKAVEMD